MKKCEHCFSVCVSDLQILCMPDPYLSFACVSLLSIFWYAVFHTLGYPHDKYAGSIPDMHPINYNSIRRRVGWDTTQSVQPSSTHKMNDVVDRKHCGYRLRYQNRWYSQRLRRW